MIDGKTSDKPGGLKFRGPDDFSHETLKKILSYEYSQREDRPEEEISYISRDLAYLALQLCEHYWREAKKAARYKKHKELEASWGEVILQATLFLVLAKNHLPEADNRPAYARATILRGQSFYNLGEYEKSIADLELAERRYEMSQNTTNDERLIVYITLGNSYWKLGKSEKAISTFRVAAVSIDILRNTNYKTSSILFYNLATALVQMGDSKASEQASEQARDYQEAIRAFTESIRRWASFDNYYNRGCVFFKTQQYELAESDFSKAIDINSDDPQCYYNRSMARSMLGKESAHDDLLHYQRMSGNPSDASENGEVKSLRTSDEPMNKGAGGERW